MARKNTYIYRVEISNGVNQPIADFCYARNRDAAVAGMKEIYPNRQAYSQFKTYVVGVTAQNYQFQRISERELAWLRSNRGKLGEKYKEVL